MFCKNCGQPILDESKFCPSCGQPVNQPAAGQAQPPAPPAAEPPAQSYQQPLPSFIPQPQPLPQPTPRPKRKKGWLIGLIAGTLVLVVLIVAVLAGGGSCVLSTAKLSEAAMASAIDTQTKEPTAKTDTFPDNAPVIYATALLSRAPEDTLVSAKWRYLTGSQEIAAVDVQSTEISQYVSFSLSMPDAGFPAGDYQVDLYIEGKLKETLTFKVNAVTRLAEAAMAAAVDPATQKPTKKADSFESDTPMIYATALLKNAPVNTKVSAKWRFLTGNDDIANVDVKSSEPTQYVSFFLSKPDADFPAGDYQVQLFIDGKLQETLEFHVIAVARLSEAAMAAEVDPVTQKPVKTATSFPASAPTIYATALLSSAPKDTLITAKWQYLTNNQAVGSVDVRSTDTKQYVSFALNKPATGFLAGQYKVEIFLNKELAATLTFEVTPAVTLSHAAMSFDVDPVTMEPLATTSVFFNDTPVLYASALLENAPVGTLITAKWIYVTSNYEIYTFDVQSTEASQYIAYYLSIPTDGFPLGDYKVEFFVNQKLATQATFVVQATPLPEASMASAVDPVTMAPVTRTDTFATNTPVIYVSTRVQDLPVGTAISADWYYITGNIAIDTVTVNTTLANQYVSFYLTKPDAGFPDGDYLVDLYVGEQLVKTLVFSVN